MTKTVVATAFGGPEVVAVIDEPTPTPGPGQVVIAVRAAGVNPIDYKSYSGVFGADPGLLPMRLGTEASGIVAAAGEGVDGLAVGDAVIAYPASGAYSTDLLANADAVLRKPDGLDWVPAAGLLLTGATAVHALTATAVESGDTVLINGASGGVGLLAVQLAVLRGAHVVATASPSAHQLLASFGATPVTYGPGVLERVQDAAPGGVDAALDLVGTDEAVETSLALVTDRDRIATIAAFRRAAQDGIKLLGGGPGADPGAEIRGAARPVLAELAGSGQLRVVIAGTFPLDEAAAAHRAIATSHAPGKFVLTA